MAVVGKQSERIRLFFIFPSARLPLLGNRQPTNERTMDRSITRSSECVKLYIDQRVLLLQFEELEVFVSFRSLEMERVMESTTAATPAGEGVETSSSEGVEFAASAVRVQWILSAIKLGSLVGICKYFFGRRDVDELFLGSFLVVALILVGMILRCQFSVRFHDFTLGRSLFDAENLVVISPALRFF